MDHGLWHGVVFHQDGYGQVGGGQCPQTTGEAGGGGMWEGGES